MHYQTATNLLAALRKGAVGSTELVEAMIARIGAVDQSLNAIVVRDFDHAQAAAAAADVARTKGDPRPLLGLPLTVKEAIDVEGLPTTWGLPGTQGKPAARDAVLVARLKAAGAIVLGKTNVPVMLSDWQTANPVYGVTNNPWDIARTPGGSSGGGAAALAAGLTPLEFGSDLAGSLRIPASFCGVFAHRPSHGLIPMRGFAPPGVPRDEIAPDIDQSTLGPMARSAADLLLALDTVIGPDYADATAYHLHLPPPRADSLKAFRVLVVDEHPLIPTATSIRTALSDIARQLEKAGCKVGRTSPVLPDFAALSTLFTELLMAFFSADMPEQHHDAAIEAAKSLRGSRDFTTAATRGTAMSHRDWVQADRRRFALAAQWRALFDVWDVVLCPASPTVAFTHDQRPFEKRTLTVDGQSLSYGMQALWAALPTPTGQPSTIMPIARDDAGLPIGMQIIGPRLEDRTTIAFASVVENLSGGFARPPV